VVAAVAREERDAPAGDRADRQRRGRRAEGRVERDLLDVVEERVEARAAEDADQEEEDDDAAGADSLFFSVFVSDVDSVALEDELPDSDDDVDEVPPAGRLSVL